MKISVAKRRDGRSIRNSLERMSSWTTSSQPTAPPTMMAGKEGLLEGTVKITKDAVGQRRGNFPRGGFAKTKY